jgi:ComF family protein
MTTDLLRRAGQAVIDFALPARCPGCGTIVDTLDAFCVDCWQQVEWLGQGCASCGLPLEATDIETCARCMAQPPRIARIRAAVAYGDIARGIVLKLKYSRKVALSRTMARYMAPMLEAGADAILVPVPLHRGRLWQRGFNQSSLVARQLAKATGREARNDLLRRSRRTRPLKGMGASQRRREVARAFAVTHPEKVAGREIVLVDDVLTTGSTAEACARTLLRAGAARVQLLCFARVIRPWSLES